MIARTVLAVATATAALLPGACTAHASEVLTAQPRKRCRGDHEHKRALRLATYNIKAGKHSSLEQVLATLKALDADVISLQEVEGGLGDADDQAAWLAEQLGMEVAFASARRARNHHFGVAILSRVPILETKRVPLPARFSLEPRVALDARLCVGAGAPLRVIAVHSDVFGWSAKANAATLAELARSSVGEGVVVAGDLNAVPTTAAVAALKGAGLLDIIGEHAEGPTFPGIFERRIDYLFVDGPLASGVRKVRIDESRASDHLPVVADFDLSSWFL
jgi:endonuclease/exonuclease/phosphatase family metal-dependent hydrolase